VTPYIVTASLYYSNKIISISYNSFVRSEFYWQTAVSLDEGLSKTIQYFKRTAAGCCMMTDEKVISWRVRAIC
jgi:hypothetical protein